MIIVPVVNSILNARRAEQAMSKAYRELQAKKYPAAIASYTTALGQHLSPGDRALAYGNRGWAWAKVERDDEAIRDFSAALQLKPNLLLPDSIVLSPIIDVENLPRRWPIMTRRSRRIRMRSTPSPIALPSTASAAS
jgi:tetratricopeptide (TPR) repeat protein